MIRIARAALVAALTFAVPAASALPLLKFKIEWTHRDGAFKESAAEIVAHDATTQRVFVVNGDKDRIDVLDAYTGNRIGSLDVAGNPNSVASKNGKVAVAVQDGTNPQANGTVVFFDADDPDIATGGTSTDIATVGAMPDMVTFTPDGSKVLVANEGEPDDYGMSGTDPVGSISIVDVADPSMVSTAGFGGYTKSALVANGVRITGPGTGMATEATAAQDIEPEYITVSPDGTKAYVTLQENNAVAEVDIASSSVTAIHALGTKDHNAGDTGFDASDEDPNVIDIRSWPTKGMYMPDTIGSYEVEGKTYLVTANEGDSREYSSFEDFDRVRDLTLDIGAFPDRDELQKNENLGRLTVSAVDFAGDVPAEYDELFSFGTRSFSIWDAATGLQVWDSGDDFEQITAALGLTDQDGNPVFNSDNDENDSFDKRSDAKGPEPEALVLGVIGDTILAFIGLERIGGIMVYDVTNPNDPEFLNYLLDRNFTVDPQTAAAGDLGPEGLYFLTPDQSPFGRYGLLVANEVSGTTTYYDIAVPLPAPLALLALGLPLLILRGRQ